jgi:hypothetical protein
MSDHAGGSNLRQLLFSFMLFFLNSVFASSVRHFFQLKLVDENDRVDVSKLSSRGL